MQYNDIDIVGKYLKSVMNNPESWISLSHSVKEILQASSKKEMIGTSLRTNLPTWLVSVCFFVPHTRTVTTPLQFMF